MAVKQLGPAPDSPTKAVRKSDLDLATRNSRAGSTTTLIEGFDHTGATDESAHLQAVLNALLPGQVLEVSANPAGGGTNISLGSTVTPPEGVSIVGPSGAASIWGYDSGYPVHFSARTGFTGTSMFKIDAGAGEKKDFHLANIALHGNHRTGGIHGIETIGTVINLELDHVTIRDFSGNGLHIASNTTGSAKGWRLYRVMSESHDGWSFYIDGLTDSGILECQAHTSTLGGFYLAGLGDARLTDLWATFVGGPGYQFADCSRSARPWGSGVQMTGIGTDRSNGPGILHAAHNNTNPITMGVVTLGRDQRNNGTVGSTLAALKIDGGSGTPAGILSIASLTTTVGYDDTGQDDTSSSPAYGVDVTNSRGLFIGSGTLWGRTAEVKPEKPGTAFLTIAPSVNRMTGTRLAPVFLGPQGPASKFSTTSSSTQGINTAGDRTFTVEAGLDFAVGMVVRAASTTNPTTVYVEGPVASYSGTTLVISPTSRVGSGSPSSWIINAVAFMTSAAGLVTTADFQRAVKVATDWVSGAAYVVGDYVKSGAHYYRVLIAHSGTTAPTVANSEPSTTGANFLYASGSSGVPNSGVVRASDGSATFTKVYSTSAPTTPTELSPKSYVDEEIADAVANVSAPARIASLAVVLWDATANSGAGGWKYKGVLVTARPAELATDDRISFRLHPTPGTMPSWSVDGDDTISTGA